MQPDNIVRTPQFEKPIRQRPRPELGYLDCVQCNLRTIVNRAWRWRALDKDEWQNLDCQNNLRLRYVIVLFRINCYKLLCLKSRTIVNIPR